MRLNQVVAVEKGAKARLNADIDTLYKAVQKPDLFEGQAKTYVKRTDQDEEQPPVIKRVQVTGEAVIKSVAERLTELFDITAQKDFANTQAKADIKVDDDVLVKDVPSTTLLFLAKQLTDLHTVVGKIPTLDSAEDWTLETATGLHKTQPTLTNRTAKIQEALVLYPHTEKHPAQTQMVTTDKVVGTWSLVKSSGALTSARRSALLTKIDKLSAAVKRAREEANLQDAPERKVGEKLLGWILA